MNKVIQSVQVWGDSILKGVIYDEVREKYLVLTHNAMTQTAQRTKLQWENHSAFGQTLPRALPRLRKHLDTSQPPDALLLELGGNDCNYNWKSVGEQPNALHFPQTPLAEFVRLLRQTVEELRQQHILPILCTLPPLDHGRFFRWITRNTDQDGVLRWLGQTQAIFDWQAQYDRCIRQVAHSLSAPLVDLRASFLRIPSYEQELCLDGMHPNAAGQERIAQTLTSFFSQLAEVGL